MSKKCRDCFHYCFWNEIYGGECLKVHCMVMPDDDCVYDKNKKIKVWSRLNSRLGAT